MRFSHLLSAAIAVGVSLSPVHGDRLRDFLATKSGLNQVTSNDFDFQEWKNTEFTVTKSTSAATTVLPKAYIVQLEPNSGLTKRGQDALSHFHKRASETIDYSVRHEFKDTKVFYGLSIQVKDDSNATTLLDIPNVIKVWPVRIVPRPSAVGAPPTGVYNVSGTAYTASATAGARANVNAVHAMTDVDRLHDLGIKGKGVKIAIMDTGVDYRHPALGGCFGPGCKVSFGHAFVDDDYAETGVAVESPDPLTTCEGGGHGTHVTGIIGMQDPVDAPFGLVGVAPEAELGMYRIFGCGAGTSSDIILLAFLQAAADKVDILSISLGSLILFTVDDPFADITTALEAQGILVVAANGNNGPNAAWTSSPAIGKGVVGIGSVQSSHFPAVYGAKDSRGRSLKYSGDPWPIQNVPTTGLRVYDFTKLAANTSSPLGCSSAAWDAALASVTDLNNSIIVAPSGGGCSSGTKLYAAYSWGFQYAIVYDVEGTDLFMKDYNSIEVSLPFRGVLMNQVDGQTLLGGLAHSKEGEYKLFFNSQVFESHTQILGGMMSNFSTMGPTSDTLALKPQLSAPGENILATWPLEATGYAILRGTSMATPYASGSFALLKSQFPTASVQELRERLQSTAKAIPWVYDKTLLSTAAAQGSGLINVYNAINFQSRVSPSELNLGDLDDLVPQQITIENKSSRSKTYVISHEPAGEINILPFQYTVTLIPRDDALDGQYPNYAGVTFSQTSITIGAGQSANITVTFSPDHKTPVEYLPVYSGFIKIKNNNDVFSVTYIGQPYSRKDANYIDHTALSGTEMPVLFSSNDFYTQFRDIGYFDFNFSSPAGAGGYPYFEFITMQSTQEILIYLVEYNTTFVPDYYGFVHDDPSNPYGVPESALPLVYPDLSLDTNIANLTSYGVWGDDYYDQKPTEFLWGIGPYVQTYNNDGSIESRDLVSGDYRALIRVLRWNGNPFYEKDYQSWLSPVLRMSYKAS